MKTKIIPFDLETAKKIQAGEIEGKMFVSDDTHNKIRIICFDRKASFPKIVALEEDKMGVEWIRECNELGQFMAPIGIRESTQVSNDTISRGIILEVPDNEPQFKPFDKVLVRCPDKTELYISRYKWIPGIFQYKSINSNLYFVSGKGYKACIPYEGNEHLVGTINNPK